MKKLLIAFVVTISLVAINSGAYAADVRIQGSFSVTRPTEPGKPSVLKCDPGITCGWLNETTCIFTDPNNYQWNWVDPPCGIPPTPEEIEAIQEALSGEGLEAYQIGLIED